MRGRVSVLSLSLSSLSLSSLCVSLSPLLSSLSLWYSFWLLFLEKCLANEGDLVSKDIYSIICSFVRKNSGSMNLAKLIFILNVLNTTDNLPYDSYFFSGYSMQGGMMMNMNQLNQSYGYDHERGLEWRVRERERDGEREREWVRVRVKVRERRERHWYPS